MVVLKRLHNSSTLGLTRNGLVVRASSNSPPAASTTTLVSRYGKCSIMLLYTLVPRLLGAEPASTRISSLPISNNLSYNSSRYSFFITGPSPLIWVSLVPVTLILILLLPSHEIKSHLTSSSPRRRSTSSPVKPALKPRAVVSIPNLLRRIDTLIPFPPGNISSELVLLISPILSSLILI